MKLLKKLIGIVFVLTIVCAPMQVLAANDTHVVVRGDSMWKIAVKYEVGLSEIISANPHIKNPSLIYPGDKISVPNKDEVKSIEQQVVDLVNEERARYGLNPLQSNWELARVARYKSQDMIDKNYFSHTSPTYGSPFKMMQDFGIRYTAAGENIAYGQRTPKEVMDAWMNSTGHRENILSAKFNQIGVGVAKSANGTLYWTQMFIRN